MKNTFFKFGLAIIILTTSSFAVIQNGNFETGSYANWSSVSGTAFVPPPSDNPYYDLVSWEGTYFANSAVNSNESRVGVLRSDTFTYPTNGFITFFVAGHSTHWAPVTNNYVVLKLASNGEILNKVLAPDQNDLRKAILQSEAAYGKNVYIEIVDDCSQGGWAWIAVDDFQLKSFSPDKNLAFKYWEVPINDDSFSGGASHEIHPPLSAVPDFDWNLVESHPAFGTIVEKFDLSEVLRFDNIFVQFEGYIDIETSGSYTFYLNSDDGSKLWIDGALIVSNDGVKSSPVEISDSTNLTVGIHKIEVGYFHNTISPVLEVNWSGPGISKQEISGDVLSSTSNTLEETGWNSFLAIIPDHQYQYNYCPSFIFDEEVGLYKIWLCGAVAGDYIVYKEAPTLEGLKYADTVNVLAPSENPAKFDQIHVCDPNVYHHTGDVFYMTYTGGANVYNQGGIGMAISYDRGRNWTKLHNGERILGIDTNVYVDGYGIGQSAVVKANDGYFYMIYSDDVGGGSPFLTQVIRCDDPAFPTNKHESVATLNPTPGASLDLAYDAANAEFIVVANASLGPNNTENPYTQIHYYYFDQNWNLKSKREVTANTGFALGEGVALLADLNKKTVQLSRGGEPCVVVAAATDEHQDNCSTFHAPWVEGDMKFVVIPLEVNLSFDNHSFEIGTYTNWTKTGAAWLDAPTNLIRHNMPADSAFYADSFFPAESDTGTLQSDPFILKKDEQISFYLAGWSGSGANSDGQNYVSLNRASDDSELDKADPPQGDNVVIKTLSHGLNEDIEVYIKAVDGNSAGGYAWIAVDDFDKAEFNYYLGKNNGFEVGDFSDWTVSGTAFGSAPKSSDAGGRAGWSGKYFANSAVGGESAVGTLRSADFSFGNGSTISFLVSGWSSLAGAGEPAYNYVALKRASNDSEVDRVWTPDNTGNMQKESFYYSGSMEYMYIEVVDNCTSDGYAWIAVDNFQLDVVPESGIIFIICYLSFLFFYLRK